MSTDVEYDMQLLGVTFRFKGISAIGELVDFAKAHCSNCWSTDYGMASEAMTGSILGDSPDVPGNSAA